MILRLSSFAIALLLASACSNEPKGTPDGTVKAYYRAANSKDFAAMGRMLAPESLKRLADPAGHIKSSFDGWQDFDITIEDVRLNSDEKSGTVRFSCTAKVISPRDRKLHPATCHDLYSVVKQPDDLWYLILPETQKVRPM